MPQKIPKNPILPCDISQKHDLPKKGPIEVYQERLKKCQSSSVPKLSQTKELNCLLEN